MKIGQPDHGIALLRRVLERQMSPGRMSLRRQRDFADYSLKRRVMLCEPKPEGKP